MTATVILGAGIIGVSTAYYLSEHQPPESIHLVDPASELFSSASGFAGGFLAKDWFSKATGPLGILSYEAHESLAEAQNGKHRWGYSPSTSISYDKSSGRGSKKRGDDWLRDGTSRADVAAAAGPATEEATRTSPAWLRRVVGDSVEVISNAGSTAQVDPLQLSQFLLQECLARGVKLHQPASAISISTGPSNELSSIRIVKRHSSTETDIRCTRIIITAGAWSGQVFAALFKDSPLKLPISSLAGHSLMVKSPRSTTEMETAVCHAIFTTSDDDGYSPEIFSRLGGNIYVAGLNSSSIPLPEVAGGSHTQSTAIAQLKRTAKELLGDDEVDGGLTVTREGLCFRPVTPWGSPIISRVSDPQLGNDITTKPGPDGGVFVAAGHGPWGISLSLGTGIVLAEMVQGRPLSADITALGIH
jgi:glycine/D-amino acid oxidase-like deaminating enzyme